MSNKLIITSNDQKEFELNYLSSSRKSGFWNKLVHLIYKIAADIFNNKYEVIYACIGNNQYEYVIEKHNFEKYQTLVI